MSKQSFSEELEELIDQFVEDGEVTKEEMISALELKLSALKEEQGDS